MNRTRSLNVSENSRDNRNGANIHPIPIIPIAKIEFSNCTELTLRYPNRTERHLIAHTERHRVSTIRLEVKPLGKNHKPVGKSKIIKAPRQIIRTFKRLATDWEILWDDGGIGASYLP